MNTVRKGDIFEDKSYELIIQAIKNGELGVIEEFARPFKKKKYYSKDREKDIEFDLAIEIWPKMSQRFSILFLIECKNYSSKKVPVDDIEEFHSKITQVAGVNVKGIMIARSSFSSGAVTFAKNKGLMLIELNLDGNSNVLLHRTDKYDIDNVPIEEKVRKLIIKNLGMQDIQGLKRLTKLNIEEIALEILYLYNGKRAGIKIDTFIQFIKTKYNLKISIKDDLQYNNGKKVLGYYDMNQKELLFDKSITQTERFPFILGHELGHFILHSNLKINQEAYNDFDDSEYNFFVDKHVLKNDRHWIEWQANRFAISLFLPRELLINELVRFRRLHGIPRPGHIHLDNQSINRNDYYKTIRHLTDYFGISKTSLIYRLEELKLITYSRVKFDNGALLRSNLGI